MAKYNIYAIAYGKDPRNNLPVIGKKCKTWDECKPYIQGVEGAKYKGFLTDEEADKWLEKNVTIEASVPTDNPWGVMVQEGAVSQKVLNAPDLVVNGEKAFTYNTEFVQYCRIHNISPVEVTLYLQEKFVNEQKFIQLKSDMPFT